MMALSTQPAALSLVAAFLLITPVYTVCFEVFLRSALAMVSDSLTSPSRMNLPNGMSVP